MKKQANQELPATSGEIMAELSKLARDIANLDRSVVALANRLHVDADRMDDRGLKNWGELQVVFSRDEKPIPNSPELTMVRDTVRVMRIGADSVFRDVAMIRAHMDAVANDAMLRDEFKSYLVNPKKS